MSLFATKGKYANESAHMKTLLIVYHSMTGGSEAMAQSVATGAACEPEVHSQLLSATQATAADVIAADACVWVMPEMLGSMSGLMKDFFDRTYYDVIDRVVGQPCAILVCAGSDGSSAVRQVQRIVRGWRLREICEPIVVCTHAQTPQAIFAHKRIADTELQRCHDLGASLAAGLTMGVF